MSDERELEDFEKMLLFLYVLEHGCKGVEDQVKKFCLITGMEKWRAESAIDVCAIKGFAGRS